MHDVIGFGGFGGFGSTEFRHIASTLIMAWRPWVLSDSRRRRMRYRAGGLSDGVKVKDVLNTAGELLCYTYQ